MTQINDSALPAHVGIILDGNRRWASQQGMPTLEGHRRGAETFKQIALHAFEKGVNNVSAYIFSHENWQRTEEEVGYLMQLVVRAVDQYLDEFHERGIRIVILGRREGLRKKVLEAISQTEQKTASNTNGTLALCFNYNGQQEIADAANNLVKTGTQITTENLSSAIYHPDVPQLDLIIRTSSEQRLSGFMLWRSPYAELYFTPTLWPAFTTADFDSALVDYAGRTRRFGE